MFPTTMNTETETAASREAVNRLARFLYAEAAHESVRTREALAAAIANQVRRLLSQQLAAASRGVPAEAIRAQLFISCLDGIRIRRSGPPSPEDPLFASCQRIARRALSGALRDPTLGATGFRKLGEPPSDGNGADAGIWIGSYVFFADAETAPRDALEFAT